MDVVDGVVVRNWYRRPGKLEASVAVDLLIFGVNNNIRGDEICYGEGGEELWELGKRRGEAGCWKLSACDNQTVAIDK